MGQWRATFALEAGGHSMQDSVWVITSSEGEWGGEFLSLEITAMIRFLDDKNFETIMILDRC
jgi:hypothetical protein